MLGQPGLGGCLFVLECCVNGPIPAEPSVQWYSGRLMTIDQLLNEYPAEFNVDDEQQLSSLSHSLLFPIIQFSVGALNRLSHQSKAGRLCKKVILLCSK